jgi:hypothetical protein
MSIAFHVVKSENENRACLKKKENFSEEARSTKKQGMILSCIKIISWQCSSTGWRKYEGPGRINKNLRMVLVLGFCNCILNGI